MKDSISCTMILLASSIIGMSAWGFGQQPASTTIVGIQQGAQFSDSQTASRGRVSGVYVFVDNDSICGLQVQFKLSNGRFSMSSRRGSSGGQRRFFQLDSDEYIVGLSGRYSTRIDSLRIHTNKRASPLFGGSGGTQDYQIDVGTGNQAVGFIGRAGRSLNAIGLSYLSLTIPLAGETIVVGGSGGSAFSDSDIPQGARISEVRVRSGEMIHAIQAVYKLGDGRVFEGEIHGGDGGTLSVFRLDSNEYLVGFSGRSGVHINSLSIRTNKRTSPVFGESRGGNIFNINVPLGNQAIGFMGRSGSYLDAIGLNYATIASSQRR